MPAWSTSFELKPSMPTQEDEFQPPSVPWGSLGLLTVGITQLPTAVIQFPAPWKTPPAQLLLVKPVSVRFKPRRR